MTVSYTRNITQQSVAGVVTKDSEGDFSAEIGIGNDSKIGIVLYFYNIERKLGGEKSVAVGVLPHESGREDKAERNGDVTSIQTDSKPPSCKICKKRLIDSFNECFPDCNDGAWDIIKKAIKNATGSWGL